MMAASLGRIDQYDPHKNNGLNMWRGQNSSLRQMILQERVKQPNDELFSFQLCGQHP